MSKMEYRTTVQNGHESPKPPEGEGWTMTGSANATHPYPSAQVFMYWQRPAPSSTRVCRKCRAVAFLDGNCVGCSTPYEVIADA